MTLSTSPASTCLLLILNQRQLENGFSFGTFVEVSHQNFPGPVGHLWGGARPDAGMALQTRLPKTNNPHDAPCLGRKPRAVALSPGPGEPQGLLDLVVSQHSSGTAKDELKTLNTLLTQGSWFLLVLISDWS